ncbi:MAG TPA: gluconate 2-dehydrogenase subunit 3 family protein [Longimicrobium sp.]|jgi:hypothetical protein
MWEMPQGSGRFLSERELAQVNALFSQIIPGDAARGIPGAADANAARYLDRTLGLEAGAYYELDAWREAYVTGLAALSAAAERLHQAALELLPPAQLQALLASLEKGELQGTPPGWDQKKFFGLLRQHCIQGCFGDPRWGGNDGKVIWRWIGYLQEPEPFPLPIVKFDGIKTQLQPGQVVP